MLSSRLDHHSYFTGICTLHLEVDDIEQVSNHILQSGNLEADFTLVKKEEEEEEKECEQVAFLLPCLH